MAPHGFFLVLIATLALTFEGEAASLGKEFCFDVLVDTDKYPGEMSYDITCEDGSCQGSCLGGPWNDYVRDSSFTETCCLQYNEGDFEITVKCEDSYGDGWEHGKGQGHLEIQGTLLCDNAFDASHTETHVVSPGELYCFDILVDTDRYPEEMSYEITCEDGSCGGKCQGGPWDESLRYTETCCLQKKADNFEIQIECMDTYDDGWDGSPNQGYLKIRGDFICDNKFTSYHIETYTVVTAASWGDWVVGECTATCGEGTVTSTRQCSGAGDCEGENEKTETCNKGACASWTEWVAGKCSASCGDGTVTSRRQCVGLGDCEGDAKKRENCNKGDCESNEYCFEVHTMVNSSGNEMSWSITCQDEYLNCGWCHEGGFTDEAKQTKTCCLNPSDDYGEIELEIICKDSNGDGWYQYYDGIVYDGNDRMYGGPTGYLEINGREICDGFPDGSTWSDYHYLKKGVWGDWIAGECSSTCGIGTRTVARHCSTIGHCEGEHAYTEHCYERACEPYSEVCFDVHTIVNSGGDEMSWSIGCSEDDCGSCQQGDFASYGNHTHSCCLNPGWTGDFEITATCKDSQGDGWYEYYEDDRSDTWGDYNWGLPTGYLKVNGKELCTGFNHGASHDHDMELKRGIWSEWVAGECTATCGDGTVTSTRQCSTNGDCGGDDEKTEPCNNNC